MTRVVVGSESLLPLITVRGTGVRSVLGTSTVVTVVYTVTGGCCVDRSELVHDLVDVGIGGVIVTTHTEITLVCMK